MKKRYSFLQTSHRGHAPLALPVASCLLEGSYETPVEVENDSIWSIAAWKVKTRLKSFHVNTNFGHLQDFFTKKPGVSTTNIEIDHAVCSPTKYLYMNRLLCFISQYTWAKLSHHFRTRQTWAFAHLKFWQTLTTKRKTCVYFKVCVSFAKYSNASFTHRS